MYSIRGKLNDGTSFRATAPDGQLGAALVGVEKAIPAGTTIVSVTLKQQDEKSQLKIIKPRAKKDKTDAASKTATAGKGKGK